MGDLLKNYSIQEILVFLIALAVAFKTVASFWDWAKAWLKEKFGKKDPTEDIETKINQLFKIQERQDAEMEKILTAVELVLESDRNNIKSWIVEKHHHFCYEVKAIDYFSLESIEKKYEHYKKEDGNSYVTTLMEELKALPKIENENIMRTQALYENDLKKVDNK